MSHRPKMTRYYFRPTIAGVSAGGTWVYVCDEPGALLAAIDKAKLVYPTASAVTLLPASIVGV